MIDPRTVSELKCCGIFTAVFLFLLRLVAIRNREFDQASERRRALEYDRRVVIQCPSPDVYRALSDLDQ